jgi:hypothetical protein
VSCVEDEVKSCPSVPEMAGSMTSECNEAVALELEDDSKCFLRL